MPVAITANRPPAAESDVFASSNDVSAWSVPCVGVGVLGDARVLVADDDPELLQAVAAALTRLGAHVTRAEDGAGLIERLAADGPFDLIVTDVAMPWMTGVRAMHAALLPKPFNLGDLESLASRLLAQRGRQPAGRGAGKGA